MNIIDKIAELTGQDVDTIESAMDNVPISNLYDLIDAAQKNDTQSVNAIINPLLQTMATTDADGSQTQEPVDDQQTQSAPQADDQTDQTEQTADNGEDQSQDQEQEETDDQEPATESVFNQNFMGRLKKEAMGDKDKNKVSGSIPKPRDPMAKALSLPQYQSKKTPSKKGLVDKAENKHKKDPKHLMDAQAKLDEGVLGMFDMQNLNRLRELAGMSDGIKFIDLNDPKPEVINLGSTLGLPDYEDSVMAQGPVDYTDELNSEIDALGLNDVEVEPEETDPLPDFSYGNFTNIQVLRNSFEDISSQLPYIQIGDFREVREMLADLTSKIDRMCNLVTGKK